MKKIERFIFIFFMLMGLIFISVGIFLFNKGIDKKDKIYTDATITDIDSNDNVTVTYNVSGNTYTKKINFYTSSYYEGKVIKIYYDKNNPSSINVDEISILNWIFIGMGIIFFIIGLIPLTIKILRNNHKQKLLNSGTYVNARFKEIIENTMYSVNGVHPYKIVCEYEYNGKTYIFKSENIWNDPYNVINERHIEYFKVYVNPNNMNKYYVDISNIEA